jgi:hypothetical protein
VGGSGKCSSERIGSITAPRVGNNWSTGSLTSLCLGFLGLFGGSIFIDCKISEKHCKCDWLEE